MINQQDIKKIATLARLEVGLNELDKFTEQMNEILNFVARLSELDTSQIAPTSHAASNAQAFREDQTVHTDIRDKVLENAPESETNFFRVPKII